MSMNNLTIDGEFRYIVQWFNEWSELQRDDFVPILVNYLTNDHNSEDDDTVGSAAATTAVNMNGLPNDLEFSGRPMSLFQCRIKLFKQWNRKWPVEFKEKLQQKITEIDSKVGEKIIMAKIDGNLTNGYASYEQKNTEQLIENDDDEHVNTKSNNAEGLFTVAINDPMIEVLNNETSVDDIETNDEVNNVNEQPLLNNIVTATTTTYGINIPVTGSVNNDNIGCSNTRHNHEMNEREEPVEQVVQMESLQINEENEEADKDKDHEDVTAKMEQKPQQQQPLPTVTVTVNPVVVTQTLTTNAEVPLVV